MSDKKWMDQVMKDNGLGDWTLEITPKGQSYCWIKQRKITLQTGVGIGLFLHEVAHALHPFPETLPSGGKHYHDGHWGDQFTSLVQRYALPKPL